MNLIQKSACFCLLAWLLSGVAEAQDSQAASKWDWLYMVKTEPSDPARDAEFNTWYDDIDIPDVLEVPSFKRARRAVTAEVSGFRSIRPKDGDGNYVALYDIATADIDTSIIDLYVAARKMSALGRLTDVLKVVEANYYRRLVSYEFVKHEDAGVYFFIEKISCCKDAQSRQIYELWYGSHYLPALKNVDGLFRVNLYELYRIMEVLALEPEEIPHLLVVYEIDGSRAAEVLTGMRRATKKSTTSGMSHPQHVVRSGLMYRQLSEVVSK